jgi:hypothetical protein
MKFSLSALAVVLLFIPFAVTAQTIESKPTKGSFYFTWGYHKDQYSRSDLHLKDKLSDNYDFTLYKAKASDRTDMHNFFKTRLTVPQYTLRVGYMFNNKRDLGIEFSWEHLKYIVEDNQMMHLKGYIHDEYYDLDTLVTPGLVHFEHTNGNNYALISLVKRHTFLTAKNQKLSAIGTVGAGALIPKTDSRVLGNHNDGPFRFSGYVVAASAGVRYELFKYFYLEPSVKGAFVNYTSAKIYLQGRAKHHFFSAQYIMAAGVNIPI